MKPLSVICSLALLALAACSSTSASRVKTQFVPPDSGLDWFAAKIADFDERSLVSKPSLDDGTDYRLMMSGVTCFEFVVRLSESSSGYLQGQVKHRDRCKTPHHFDEHNFIPSRPRYEELKALIDRAGMFEHYPEFWVVKGDEICLDGVEMYFERQEEGQHAISSANTPCTAPGKLREIARKFAVISKDEDVVAFSELVGLK